MTRATERIARREPVPSPRELELGRTTRAFSASAETEDRADGTQALRGWAAVRRSFNPWALTAGYPVAPLMVFSLIGGLSAMWSFAFVVVSPQVGTVVGTANAVALGAILNSVPQGLRLTGPLLGFYADRYRMRAWLLRIGVLIWFTGYTMVGMAQNWIAFIIAFTVGYIGSTLFTPSGTILADVYPVSVRADAPYFSQRVAQLAQVVGPILGGALAAVLGWQWMLIALGALGLAAVPATFLVKEPRRGAADAGAAGAQQAEPDETAKVPLSAAFRTVMAIPSFKRYMLALPWQALALSAAPIAVVFFAQRYNLGAFALGLVIAGTGLSGILGLTLTSGLVQRLNQANPSRMVALAGLILLVASVLLLATTLVPTLPLALLCLLIASAMLPLTSAAMSTVPLLVLPPQVRTFGLEVSQTAIILLLPWLLWAPKTFNSALAAIGVRVPAESQLMIALVPTVAAAGLLLSRAAAFMERDIRSAKAAAAALLASRRKSTDGANAMLVCRGIDVHYGGAQVLFGVDLDVDEGEVLALLGTNGAGKSTLLRAISGVHAPSAGAVFLDGEDVTRTPAHEKAAKGVVMMPGGRAVFPSLTVAENLQSAAWLYRSDDEDLARRREEVERLFPIVRERAGAVAGSLSGGEQQMVALAQAFLMRPRLLMIDELSLGLAPSVVEQLLSSVRAIAAGGTTVILVEQSVNVALSVARRAVFMEKGEIRYDGPAAELLEQREVLRSVFLSSARGSATVTGSRTSQRASWESAPEVLSVAGAAVSFGGVRALDGVDLSLRAGEVVGIIGPNGAGKTTLFDVVSGFVPPDAGVVRIAGRDVTTASPTTRARLGLSRSFQNVRLFPAMTVRENIAVALERSMGSQTLVAAALRLPAYRAAERRAARRIESLVDGLGLGAFADKFISELSTGSRRIVDIACVLASGPQVLLLDEPTSGLAQAETEELGPFIGRIVQETGCGVLVIEHDLALVSAVSDRMVAMRLGRVMAEGLPAAVLDDEQVQRAIVGEADAAVVRSGALAGEGAGLDALTSRAAR